jgi:taurine transport system substrate-binding protein
LAHAGIAEGDVTVMNMPPDQIAAAWEQGAIDAAFIWQPVQSQILETGTLLVGADETAAWGYPTFDGWVVDRTFAAENAEAMAAFARTMDEANAAYLADPAAWTADSAQVATIAEQTGADPAQVPGILAASRSSRFPSSLARPGSGSAPATMKSTADFLVTAGRIDAAADDYSSFVNTDIAAASQ